MLTVILVFLGIANLAVQIYNAWTLKRIGKEINQVEDWKSIPKKTCF